MMVTSTSSEQSVFSPKVSHYWQTRFARGIPYSSSAELVLRVDDSLDEGEAGMVLQRPGQPVSGLISPAMAKAVGPRPLTSLEDLQAAVQEAGGRFHGADALFYFPLAVQAGLSAAPAGGPVRQLNADDAAVFEAFSEQASEEDRDASYVELDHWLVFGAFDGEELACAASMYAWDEDEFGLADLGVLTHADKRGRGYARATVRAMCHCALHQGWEPQYCFQGDNLASASVARGAGLELYGYWDVILPPA